MTTTRSPGCFSGGFLTWHTLSRTWAAGGLGAELWPGVLFMSVTVTAAFRKREQSACGGLLLRSRVQITVLRKQLKLDRRSRRFLRTRSDRPLACGHSELVVVVVRELGCPLHVLGVWVSEIDFDPLSTGFACCFA